jgi:hypothetical protein
VTISEKDVRKVRIQNTENYKMVSFSEKECQNSKIGGHLGMSCINLE